MRLKNYTKQPNNTDYSFLRSIERRDFLKIISFTGAAGLIYPARLISEITADPLTRVVIVQDSMATSSNHKINAAVVQNMIDSGIKALTNINDIGEAWKSNFPGITVSSGICLKVNCINTSVSTNPEVAYGVANGLKKMDFGGSLFSENKIIIFDRTTNELRNAHRTYTNLRYTINQTTTGVRCFGTDAGGVGYDTQNYTVVGSSQRVTKILTDLTEFMVNCAVLKNHSPGCTLCLKNHYGTINNPGGLHSDGDNQIPELNTLPPILNKQKVFIIDALYGVIQGGPGGSPQINPNTIIMGTDIVAVDKAGCKLLADNGCKSIPAAKHVDIASTKYKLGTNDPLMIETINIQDPSQISEPHNSDGSGLIIEQNYPNPFSSYTNINIYSDRTINAELAIFDLKGTKVNTIIDEEVNKGWHSAVWSGTDDSGNLCHDGYYICRLKTSNYHKSIILNLIK